MEAPGEGFTRPGLERDTVLPVPFVWQEASQMDAPTCTGSFAWSSCDPHTAEGAGGQSTQPVSAQTLF